MNAATPLRELGTVDPAGYRLVRDVGSSYRDGAEDELLRIVDEADDLTSTSDELVLRAKGWAQRYHLDPARANIVRCLALPPDARVLEIGAGCGAITRYLGEQCATVDALEPVPARAAVARARTRDLPGVEVVVGELDDVPDVATYDVVVVIGVLEYVGNGSDDRAPYLDFLAGIRSRLLEGGALALAIENQLGVKYLAGAPEDHTNRVFDGPEGYPRGGQARTFSRRGLEDLMREAGLHPQTRSAFPDYKLTRAVLGEFPASAQSLLWRVPAFPSPDWRAARPRLLDERALWRSFVQAGTAAEHGNSFLTLASTSGTTALWPAERAGVFYSPERRPHLTTQTVIETTGDSVLLRRTRVAPADAPGIRIAESDAAYQPGTDVTDVVAADGVAAFEKLAPEWLTLLDAAIESDPGSAVDVVPHNLVVDERDRLHTIDIEYADTPLPREHVLRRGVYWLAVRSTALAAPERWAPHRTVREVARALGSVVGLPGDGSWLEPAVVEEVEWLATVRSGPPAGLDLASWKQRMQRTLGRNLDRTLTDQPLGDRVYDVQRRQQARCEGLEAELARASAELAATRKQLASSESARLKVAASREWRAVQGVKRRVARLLPAHSRRRALARRVLAPSAAPRPTKGSR